MTTTKVLIDVKEGLRQVAIRAAGGEEQTALFLNGFLSICYQFEETPP